MSEYTRQFEVERASVDAEAGTFRAVLFTDGEATDGHVLNIKGGKMPERMPLFVNHSADPTTQLGSLYYEDRDDHKIHVRGEIFTEGEGAPLEVRRDLLAKMAAGHVSRMSGRWDAADKDIKRRINLPSDHPAFIDDSKETEYRKKWGLFFEKWTGMEGSVVGLGADPQAVMRWASDEEAPECVREFWRGQVPEAQLSGVVATVQANIREAIEAGVDPAEIASFLPAEEPEPEPERAEPAEEPENDPEPKLRLIRDGESVRVDLSPILERLDALEDGRDDEPDLEAITKRLDALEASPPEPESDPTPSASEDPGRVEPDAPPPSAPTEVFTPREVFVELHAQLKAARKEVMDELRARLAAARGKVE